MSDYHDRFFNYAENIRKRTAEMLPTESRKRTLEVKNIRLEDTSPDRIHRWDEFQKAKEIGGSFLGRVVADVTLRDKKTGKVVDAKKDHTLTYFPHMNALGSYIVNGKELQVVNQLRRLPGAYPTIRSDNNAETKITAAGLNHNTVFDRESGDLLLKVRSSHLKLVPLLEEMGVKRDTMEKAFGKDLVDHNMSKARKGSELSRFFKLTRRIAEPATHEETKKVTNEWLASKKVTIAKDTIGTDHAHVSPELYLDSARAAVEVARGKRKPADMESLVYKSIHSIEDFVDEAMERSTQSMQNRTAYLMDRKSKINAILSPAQLSKPIINKFVTSEFTRFSNQNNPLDILGTMHTVTMLGEGGIQSSHAITDTLRNVHNSHAGFLDVVHTPENSSIGVVTHLAHGVKKKGNQLYQRVFDTHTNKMVDATPIDVARGGLGFPDYYKQVKGKFVPRKASVIGISNGEIKTVKAKELRYVIPNSSTLFSAVTNGIPFMNANSANRMLMADRHIEQAVPLTDPESPLVQADMHGKPYDQVMGNLIGYVAQKPGRISSVKKDKIVVKYDSDSKPTDVHFPTDYPMNGESYLTLAPKVKTGQRIKPGQQLFSTNFTRNDSLALGKNLTTAIMPWRGLSYEDGIVISEAAAQKLMSTHKHELEVDKTGGVEVGHDKLFAHFPDQRERHVAGRDQALPKVGQVLKTGDLVIPAISPVRIDADTDYGRVHKALRSPFRNSSVYWDNDANGIVKKVINTHGMTRVYVETKEPLVVGDKISTRAGSKGIVTAVIPDNQMPRIKASGDPVDVLFNPYGIPGRVNPTFLMENARSKIADKTGKTEVVKSFDTQATPSIVGSTLADLKKHGLSDTETLFDPTHQTDHNNVMVGKNYWLKLKHQVRNKMSGRSHEGAYTKDERPSRGGGESAQSIGPLEVYSLMSGGMTNFLRDATGIKGTKNSEYWNAFQLGLPTPQPKTPLIMEKFEHYLRGAGINVTRHGNKLKASPFTDKDILARSSGGITTPNVLRTGKNGLHPERGGLFDPAITGGFDAIKSNHIELPERMLNPLYEHPAASVLGLSTKELNGYLSGKTEHEGKYAGEALAAMLGKIDVKAELKETATALKTAPKTKRDKMLRRLKYLNSLDQLGLSPQEAYTNKLIHVIPTKFRPIYDLPDGSLNVADANHGYREILFVAKELERLKNMGADDEHLAPLRKGLYEAYSGLTGLTEPLTRSGSFRGFISNIAGAQNKHGLFQSKVVARRQDLSGRSTIINAPHLGMDEVGIPYEMAQQIYKPYIVRELVTSAGLKPVDAREEVEKGSERVDKLIEVVMRNRPVLLNRAPSLHKFSTIPLLPHPVRGKAIQLNPLVFGGLNADIDGDTVAVHVPHSEAAREELLRNLPSKQLFSPKSGGVQHSVGAEATLGLYMATKPNKLLDTVEVSSPEAALKLLRENQIKMNQPLKYQKQTWTAGHFLMNQILPQPYHFDSPSVMNGASWRKMTNDIAQTHPEQAGQVISKMKDLGFDASSRLGFSIDLKSLVVAEVERDAIAKEVTKRAKTDPVKAIEWGTKQMDRILNDLPEDHPYKMMTFGSGAKNNHRVNVRQLMLAPVGVTNNKGAVVPVPILRSYADGLDTAQYWATLPGARKGIADRAVSTQETGAFAKELLNTTINTRITSKDCGTKQGIQMAADHPDFVGRYMASGAHGGELISGAMASALQKKGGTYSVRSPMTCELTDGVCQKCAGLNESGQNFPVGFHLGAYAGTTISEPITQMVMRAFHTQGAIGGQEIGFKRVRQIFAMPENIKGKATLAQTEGTVDNIAEAAGGGWNVTVDGEKHFLLQESGLGVKLNQKVGKGQQLSSTGVLKLQEIAELRGHEAARDQLLADLDDEMGSAGQRIRRRIYEMAVKPMIDKVEVIDPGDAAEQGMVEGDIVNVNYIKQLNSKLKNPVDYHPVIMSIKEVPFSGEDFIGPLQYQRLPRTLREAPAVGAESILKGKGSHPIVEYATGNI